jgi:pimeloyl-ACP methyl ester carboxylesterase
MPGPAIKNVVLVHGGFVDGSGWRGVYDILKRDGFDVRIVQNPTISLQGDVAATKLIIDQMPGDVILVGHSYGGAVITEAGTHPKVAGLVYITAFAPDAGESVNTIIASAPPGAPVPPILPPSEGYLFLDRAKMPAAFAGDVDAATAGFMADSQVPWGLDALGQQITTPAWKTKPSWYLLVTDDKMIPLPAQQFMSKRAGSTTKQVSGSHAIYVSNADAVASLIAMAAGSPSFAGANTV